MNYYNFSFLMIFLLCTLIYLPLIFIDTHSILAADEEESSSSDEEESSSSDEEESSSSDEEESENNNDQFLKESEDPITKYFGDTTPPEGGTPPECGTPPEGGTPPDDNKPTCEVGQIRVNDNCAHKEEVSKNIQDE